MYIDKSKENRVSTGIIFIAFAKYLHACGSKSTLASPCITQLRDFHKARCKDRRNNQLGNSVPVTDDLGLISMIVQRHNKFTAVITVDHTYFISRRKATLAGQATAGIDESGIATGQLSTAS